MKKTSKIISVLVVLIAGSMVASGVVLPYLSNTVTTGEVTAKLPIALTIRNDDALIDPIWWCAGEYVPSEGLWEGPLSSVDVYGGETYGFWIHVENLADATISGNMEVTATCDTGFSNDGTYVTDFTVDYYVYEQHSYGNEMDSYPGMSIPYTLWGTASFGDDFSLGSGGEFYVYVDVHFNSGASGTYTFTSQMTTA